MNRFASALIGLAVGWLICCLEYAFTATAWGGPFTVLMIPVVAGFISGVCVLAATLFGLLLRLSPLRDVWQRVGYKVVFIAVIPVLILAFSSLLGLRSIEPVSGYSMMSPWVGWPCYFVIVFPFVNLPIEQKLISTGNHEG
jgi:hypothetical protein